MDLERIRLVQGDITRQNTDAIVNAANESLLGGLGVDGAIHAAAGPELLAECRTLGGCPTGEARSTKGYDLQARYVIHTVGPVYRNRGDEARLLAACYRNGLLEARKLGLSSVAFPSLSTGAYGYPTEEAAPVALESLARTLAEIPELREVRMVLFSKRDFDIYHAAYKRLSRAENGGVRS